MDSAHRHSRTARPEAPAILSQGLASTVLRLLAPGDVRPTHAQAAAFSAFGQVGDPAVDALVAAFRRTGVRAGRAQFEQALENGIESVADPLPELVAFFAEIERVPFWVDYAVLDVASSAMARIPFSTLLSLTAAVTLPASYVSPQVNAVLLRGGDLDRRAAGRVLETVEWLVACSEPQGMERFGAGFTTTARVRLVHGFIRAGVTDLDDSDQMPISQLHSCVTMIPLVAVALGTVALGHLQSRKERDATVQLYRYMAHLMGVAPQLQAGSLPELYRLVWLAGWSEVAPDASSIALTRAVLDCVTDLYAAPADTHPLRHKAISRLHHDLARITLGTEYADAVHVAPLSGWALSLPAYAALHAGAEVVRRAIPGSTGRAAARGHRRRAAALRHFKQRVATVPFSRDDAVSRVRSNDARLRRAHAST